ncbi:MAG: pyruvate kinase [Deltaproteobacteria bacterium]|nr:pyruvate kinase [Deltaproteobacteria bacterium]
MRRAKIVCTLGPSSNTPEAIEALIAAGMDVARLNFSHGDHDFHRTMVNRVRAASTRMNKPVAILQDLQGPKIRCLMMEGGAIELKGGARTVITVDDVLGTPERFGTLYKALPRDVSVGEHILLDDGNLSLKVLAKTDRDVTCEVVHGGILKDKKGINLPDTKVSAPSLTDKDIRDAHFGAEVGVDAVALSFVRTRNDVRMLRRELAQTKSRPIVIAKIEKPQAIEQIEGILEEADGVMVARGDLGVEMPTEKVPTLQKMLVEQANRRGKIVIVATQMLESMITNARPTRAEASDVANAVLDGADAVMLSAETASGKHPELVVQTMARIVLEAEQSERARYVKLDFLAAAEAQDFQNAVSQAGVRAAHELHASAIVVFSTSGSTARLVSDYRPRVPILALVPSPTEQRRLAFAWGVKADAIEVPKTVEELLAIADQRLEDRGVASPSDTVVMLYKQPLQSSQRTNTMLLHVVGAGRSRA